MNNKRLKRNYQSLIELIRGSIYVLGLCMRLDYIEDIVGLDINSATNIRYFFALDSTSAQHIKNSHA